ncbi:hypothetical protein Chro_0670 [Chroococcidiopsis thermalis PCC 7203]|uniref:Uncharacterized protein n=1 Tax=Chroococcidiopsis thermalis (strain PCC 7203) TaxID=251229 RepID=K9TVL9_CHRTP|nr:hypothetical protein Chro_0670 [Chroococcidiopsis thermalis PCC 7203]
MPACEYNSQADSKNPFQWVKVCLLVYFSGLQLSAMNLSSWRVSSIMLQALNQEYIWLKCFVLLVREN